MVNKKIQKGGAGHTLDLNHKVGGLPVRVGYSECPKKNTPAARYGQVGGKKKTMKKTKKGKKGNKSKKSYRSKKSKKSKKGKKGRK